jgi:hypothetical protein
LLTSFLSDKPLVEKEYRHRILQILAGKSVFATSISWQFLLIILTNRTHDQYTATRAKYSPLAKHPFEHCFTSDAV